MDEPLSDLDAKLRVEITRLQRELRVTTIYVTHDQIEVMTMGHRIAVIRKGVLQQEGPEHLHDALPGDKGQPRLSAEVTPVEALGPERQVHLKLAARC